MPELPEVTLITNCLHNELKNKYFINLTLTDKSRYTKDNNLTLDNYKLIDKKYEELDGNYIFSNTQKILKVFNKGKKIFIKLDNGVFIASFLSLHGTWQFNKKDGYKCYITYSDTEKSKLKYIYYYDSRNFGQMNIISDYKEILTTTGIDYFDRKMTFGFFLENLRKIQNNKRYKTPKNIAQFLGMQEVMSGIGVYIKSECLYRTKLSPYKELSEISDKKAKKLYNNILRVMDESFNAGGFSYQDYVSPHGIKGKFKTQITYKTKDIHDNLIEKIKVDGENVHYCPSIQI